MQRGVRCQQMPKLGFQFQQCYWIRHLTEAFEQLANALLFGVRGQGGRELLSGKIHTSDDPAASPQGEDDQRNDEHTDHMVRLAITRTSVQLTRAFLPRAPTRHKFVQIFGGYILWRSRLDCRLCGREPYPKTVSRTQRQRLAGQSWQRPHISSGKHPRDFPCH